MDHVVQHFFFFFIIIYITISSAADFLQNPGFEIPPPNVTANGSRVISSIPGWSISGTVWYVAWPDDSTAAAASHALQLGPSGKINQTLKASGDYLLHYVLSFTVAAHNQDCANNRTALKLTLQEQGSSRDVSRVIHLQQNSSRNLWERHAFFLGLLGGGEHVHIQIESVATNSCWPLVDAFFVNRNQVPTWQNGNLLANAGFEVGPAFLNNSWDGIILNEELQNSESPLQEWSILGTVRYIESRHFAVPRGRAAVELLSGDPSGVRKEMVYFPSPTTSRYTLNFTLGDANDSCVGNFMVHVQVGSSVYNFTMQSSGRGSAFRHSFAFKTKPSSKTTSISFYSFDEARTRDGLLCGPVVDDIFLDVSYGERMNGAVCNEVLALSLFIAFVMLIVL